MFDGEDESCARLQEDEVCSARLQEDVSCIRIEPESYDGNTTLDESSSTLEDYTSTSTTTSEERRMSESRAPIETSVIRHASTLKSELISRNFRDSVPVYSVLASPRSDSTTYPEGYSSYQTQCDSSSMSSCERYFNVLPAAERTPVKHSSVPTQEPLHMGLPVVNQHSGPVNQIPVEHTSFTPWYFNIASLRNDQPSQFSPRVTPEPVGTFQALPGSWMHHVYPWSYQPPYFLNGLNPGLGHEPVSNDRRTASVCPQNMDPRTEPPGQSHSQEGTMSLTQARMTSDSHESSSHLSKNELEVKNFLPISPPPASFNADHIAPHQSFITGELVNCESSQSTSSSQGSAACTGRGDQGVDVERYHPLFAVVAGGPALPGFDHISARPSAYWPWYVPDQSIRTAIGYSNVGNQQSGNQHSGNLQSGNQQSVNQQSVIQHSGNLQSGNQQSGNQQSGNQQSGNQQSGKQQSGNNQGRVSYEEDNPRGGFVIHAPLNSQGMECDPTSTQDKVFSEELRRDRNVVLRPGGVLPLHFSALPSTYGDVHVPGQPPGIIQAHPGLPGTSRPPSLVYHEMSGAAGDPINAYSSPASSGRKRKVGKREGTQTNTATSTTCDGTQTNSATSTARGRPYSSFV